MARLASGLTAGEELLLEDLATRRTPLHTRDLLVWHERLPPLAAVPEATAPVLVEAVVFKEVVTARG